MKQKIVNYLLCALVYATFGILCGLCFAISGNKPILEIETLAVCGIFAIFWVLIMLSLFKCRIKDAVKSFGISTVILVITGLICQANINANFRFFLLLMSTAAIPFVIAERFSSISDEKARNESPEMQLAKKVADWCRSKYLTEVRGVDEDTASNFHRCLTGILYSHSDCESYILASGYGDLQRLEKKFGLPKRVFPEDLVIFILYKDNKAYYNYMLSSPGIEII